MKLSISFLSARTPSRFYLGNKTYLPFITVSFPFLWITLGLTISAKEERLWISGVSWSWKIPGWTMDCLLQLYNVASETSLWYYYTGQIFIIETSMCFLWRAFSMVLLDILVLLFCLLQLCNTVVNILKLAYISTELELQAHFGEVLCHHCHWHWFCRIWWSVTHLDKFR